MAISIYRFGIVEQMPRVVAMPGDGLTVRELVMALASQFGDGIREGLIDGKELREAVCILVNGRNVGSLDGLETRLRGDEEILITTAFTGG